MKLDARIKQELKKAYAEIRGRKMSVEIISSYPMTDSDKQQLLKLFPFLNEASVEYSVEPDLLAGIVIKYGSKMIDLSLRSELTQLQHFVYERL